MKRAAVWSGLAGGGAAFAILLLVFCMRVDNPLNRWWMATRGNHVVARIEAYRQQHGYIPDHLDDIGIKETESGTLYYSHRDEEYVLWYSIGFDYSYGYESRKKSWTEFPEILR